MLCFNAKDRKVISRTPEEQRKKNEVHERSRNTMLAAKALKLEHARKRREIRAIIHHMRAIQRLPDTTQNRADFEMCARKIDSIRRSRDFNKIRTIGLKVTF